MTSGTLGETEHQEDQVKISTTIRTIAAALAIATTLQPAAAAADIVPRRDGSKAVIVPADTTQAATRPQAGDGFDWADAGLGAAGAAISLALAAAGAAALRRRQTGRVAPS